MSFKPGTDVGMKVAISYTSLNAAKANLDAEIRDRDTVTSVARAADRQWDEQLSRIEVAGGSDEQRTKLYTALYHSFLQPNVVNDVAGTYWGADQRIHRLARGQRASSATSRGGISTARTRSSSRCWNRRSRVIARSRCSTSVVSTAARGTGGST